MAVPEMNGFQNGEFLTPADLSPEALIDFARYCRASENSLMAEVFREHIRIETPFPTSAGEEEDIFRSAFVPRDEES